MDIDGNRRILHVGRRVAVEIPLLDEAILEGDRAFRHQLTEAKYDASLNLALDRERIDRESDVNRHGRSMDPGSIALD